MYLLKLWPFVILIFVTWRERGRDRESSGELEMFEMFSVLSQAESLMDFKTYFATEALINDCHPPLLTVPLLIHFHVKLII